MSFSEWRKYTVQELVDQKMLDKPLDGNHGGMHPKTSDYVSSGIPFIMANDLKNGKVDYSCCNFITEKQAKTLKKGFAKPGDVLLTHKATIGRTAIVDNSYPYIVLTPQVTYYRVLKGIDNKYLKYYFDSKDFQDLLLNWSGSGSTRAYLGITAQLKLPVILPSLPEQKAIAATLSALDDMIELNNQINKTLEEMAQAIFKSWFVDFEPFKDGEFEESELGLIPKGWRVGTLGEIAEITSGKRPISKQEEETLDFNVPLVGASSIMGYVNEVLYNEPIIVIGRVGTHGVVQRFNKQCWPSDNTLILKSSYYEFVYQILRKIDYKTLNRGSTQPLITQTDIKNYKIIIPDNICLSQFEDTLKTLFDQYIVNNLESKHLAIIRDTLLPKLMSGEIRVPVEEVV